MLKILETGIHGQRGGFKFDTSATLEKGAVVYISGEDDTLDCTMVQDVQGGVLLSSGWHAPGACYVLYQEELDDELGTAAQDSITCGTYVSLLGQGVVVESSYFETTQIVAGTTVGSLLGVSTGGKICPYASSIGQWLGLYAGDLRAPKMRVGPIAILEKFVESGDADWVRYRML